MNSGDAAHGRALAVQPLSAHHAAAGRVRQDGDGARLVPLPQEGGPRPTGQHHEGDQPPALQPPGHAIRHRLTGMAPRVKYGLPLIQI